MSDLFEDPSPPGNAPEFTVSEIAGAVKRTIEGEFGFVRVRGEISRVSRPASGHLYFDLKDDKSVLNGVIWKGQAARLATRPEEGLEVIATGKLTTFPGGSRYQMIIDDIAPAGVGALMAMLEKRKAMLAAEGLFAPNRKQPLPFLPDVIGIVTSPSGAVIRDILHRLRDRFPRRVLVWPVAVQGKACAAEVAAAIAGFNRMTPGGALPRPDLLIVARGGGSIEDLWGFNDEIVVRAAAASRIPLISAIGHETDTTLIDFAADLRAPTPTAAAERAVPVRLDLLAWVGEQGARLTRGVGQGVQIRVQRVRDLGRVLAKPETLLNGPRQRLDNLSDRLPAGLRKAIARKQLDLSKAGGVLRPAILQRKLDRDAERLTERAYRLAPALSRAVQAKRPGLEKLRLRDMSAVLDQRRFALDKVSARLKNQIDRKLPDLQTRLTNLAKLHATLGYEQTLRRGFAVVRGDGAIVASVQAARSAAAIEIQFADGKLDLGSAPKPKRPVPAGPDQGNLF